MNKKILLPFILAISFVALGCENPITTSSTPDDADAAPELGVITLLAIQGVTIPAAGAVPVTSITETSQYTGTVEWGSSPATFADGYGYVARITLTPKPGFTLSGILANSFTVNGASSLGNSASSGIINATFTTLGTDAIGFPVPGAI